jgi:translation initiation factor 1
MSKKKPPPESAAAPRALSSFADLLRARGVGVGAPAPTPPRETSADPPAVAMTGKVVLRRERKGHGGKTVTVIDGLRAPAAALDTLARELRKALGCGARVDDGRIIVQGDCAPAVDRWLRARGATHIVHGT